MLERILDSDNMNRAYLRVKRNHGSGGVDGMSVEELGEYLAANKDEILQAIDRLRQAGYVFFLDYYQKVSV